MLTTMATTTFRFDAMGGKHSDPFVAVAVDGKARTSQEVAGMLGIPPAQAIQFLTDYKTALIISRSKWKLLKFKGEDKQTRWRLVKR